MVQQRVSVITLGVEDLERSRRFYGEGFGWTPVFDNPEILFFQLNGLVLGIFLKPSLEEDMSRACPSNAAAFALAHNVAEEAEVAPLLQRLVEAGGQMLRPANAPPHGGFRGYVADPDGHAWEIAWNPGFAMDADGNINFGV